MAFGEGLVDFFGNVAEQDIIPEYFRSRQAAQNLLMQRQQMDLQQEQMKMAKEAQKLQQQKMDMDFLMSLYEVSGATPVGEDVPSSVLDMFMPLNKYTHMERMQMKKGRAKEDEEPIPMIPSTIATMMAAGLNDQLVKDMGGVELVALGLMDLPVDKGSSYYAQLVELSKALNQGDETVRIPEMMARGLIDRLDPRFLLAAGGTEQVVADMQKLPYKAAMELYDSITNVQPESMKLRVDDIAAQSYVDTYDLLGRRHGAAWFKHEAEFFSSDQAKQFKDYLAALERLLHDEQEARDKAREEAMKEGADLSKKLWDHIEDMWSSVLDTGKVALVREEEMLGIGKEDRAELYEQLRDNTTSPFIAMVAGELRNPVYIGSGVKSARELLRKWIAWYPYIDVNGVLTDFPLTREDIRAAGVSEEWIIEEIFKQFHTLYKPMTYEESQKTQWNR